MLVLRALLGILAVRVLRARQEILGRQMQEEEAGREPELQELVGPEERGAREGHQGRLGLEAAL